MVMSTKLSTNQPTTTRNKGAGQKEGNAVEIEIPANHSTASLAEISNTGRPSLQKAFFDKADSAFSGAPENHQPTRFLLRCSVNERWMNSTKKKNHT